MTPLLEDPTIALIAAAVLITMAAIAYSTLRTRGAFLALVGTILFGVVGVGVEQLVVTPREQAATALQGLLDAVEANDLPGVLARLAPSASSVRADAERLMPQVVVEKANQVGSIKVTLDSDQSPSQAEVKCRVFVSAHHRTSGTKGGDFDDITFLFTRHGERWLLESYTAGKQWQRGANHLRSTR